MAIDIISLYRQLFGKRDPVDGNVIDMSEHGRGGGVSTGQGFKFIDNVQYVTEIDYNSGTNPIYIGIANPGTATSAASWQIRKLTYDANNNVTAIQWAGGSADFATAWDSRASASYS